MQLLGTPLGEKIAAVADDIIVRQMDFNGSDIVADRLAAANPLAQIDEERDPAAGADDDQGPAAAAAEGHARRSRQAGVELKFGGLEKEAIKQEGETKRDAHHQTTKAHDTETIAPRSATTPRRAPSPRRTWPRSTASVASCSSTSTPATSSARSPRANAEQRQKAAMDASTATAQ
jgi:hypothetical protein